MSSILSLLNKDSPPPSPPHPTNASSSSSLSSTLTLLTNTTNTGAVSHNANPLADSPSCARWSHSAPLKRKCTDPAGTVLSDSLRHRLRELPADVLDSDEDSVGKCEDDLPKSRKLATSPSPRSSRACTPTSMPSIQQLLEDGTSPPLLPRFKMMNIQPRPTSPLAWERSSYTSPLIQTSPAKLSSASPSSLPRSAQLSRHRTPPHESTHPRRHSASLSPEQFHDDSTSGFGDCRRPSLDTGCADVATLRQHFEAVTAENDRLRDFNKSLLSKIERSYEQLLQSQGRPEQLSKARDELQVLVAQRQAQLKQLREEWEFLITQLHE